MFEKIIGYESEKRELSRFCDAIINTEYYKSLGITIPKGILLYGDPGLGKTTFANSMIEACGRPYFILRKNADTAQFIENIRHTFEEAKNVAPSIILLDDVDKFGNGERFAQEYTALQGAIDDYKPYDIFIIATANDFYNLPVSLTRTGRFDAILKIEKPRGTESGMISNYYIDNKSINIDPNVNRNTIGRLLDGSSCSTIEVVINSAAMYAAYDRSPTITMDHFVNAIMSIVYLKPMDKHDNRTYQEKYINAIYNAGKGVMKFLLAPDKFKFITIRETSYDAVTDRGNVNNNDRMNDLFSFSENPNLPDIFNFITITLAGKLTYEMKFNTYCTGAIYEAYEDMSAIQSAISMSIGSESGMTGMRGVSGNDFPTAISEDQTDKMLGKETPKLTQEYLLKTAGDYCKSLLLHNWQFVEAVANVLINQKDVLIYDDLVYIKNNICRANNTMLPSFNVLLPSFNILR